MSQRRGQCRFCNASITWSYMRRLWVTVTRRDAKCDWVVNGRHEPK